MARSRLLGRGSIAGKRGGGLFFIEGIGRPGRWRRGRRRGWSTPPLGEDRTEKEEHSGENGDEAHYGGILGNKEVCGTNLMEAVE